MLKSANYLAWHTIFEEKNKHRITQLIENWDSHGRKFLGFEVTYDHKSEALRIRAENTKFNYA